MATAADEGHPVSRRTHQRQAGGQEGRGGYTNPFPYPSRIEWRIQPTVMLAVLLLLTGCQYDPYAHTYTTRKAQSIGRGGLLQPHGADRHAGRTGCAEGQALSHRAARGRDVRRRQRPPVASALRRQTSSTAS